MKKKLSIAIMVMLLINQQMLSTAYADDINNDDVTVNLCVEFSEEDAIAYQKSIEETMDSCMEELENEILVSKDEKKVELLKDYVSDMEDYDADELFDYNNDGTCVIKVPCENTELVIDGKSIETDINGKIDSSELKSNNIDINNLIVNYENANVETEINNDKSECNIKMSFEVFSDGVKEMSDSMNEANAQSVKQLFYMQRDVGDTFGYGAGKTRVYFKNNIVGCNKCDKSLSKVYTTKEFALGNSDCAKSVKLGLVALSSNAALAIYYRYSIYCVQEGMTSVMNTDNNKNAYCDGTKKSGGHVNCSWFNGIGHSESFHTHIYK